MSDVVYVSAIVLAGFFGFYLGSESFHASPPDGFFVGRIEGTDLYILGKDGHETKYALAPTH